MITVTMFRSGPSAGRWWRLLQRPGWMLQTSVQQRELCWALWPVLVSWPRWVSELSRDLISYITLRCLECCHLKELGLDCRISCRREPSPGETAPSWPTPTGRPTTLTTPTVSSTACGCEEMTTPGTTSPAGGRSRTCVRRLPGAGGEHLNLVLSQLLLLHQIIKQYLLLVTWKYKYFIIDSMTDIIRVSCH